MLRNATWLAAFLCLGLVTPACTEGSRNAHQDASSPFACDGPADCDDSIACTVDNCGANHLCTHTAIDATCTGAGEHCVVGVGCTTTMSCTESSMCDDGIACTVDSCNVGNVCGHQPVNASCTDPAMPVCDAMLGCVPGQTVECMTAAQCSDDIDCTLDTCAVDMTCRHMPVDSLCTVAGERCEVGLGCQAVHSCATVGDCTPDAETWWNFCDGDAMCDTEFGCSFPTPRDCHDTDACTIDTCDRAAGAHGACVYVCDTGNAACNCPTPQPSCAGRFALTPAPTGACTIVSWNLSTVTIENIDGTITVTPNHLSGGSMDTGTDTATCPTFTATTTISGGCDETYTFTATFIDDDHITGTFYADFHPDSPGACGCNNHREYPFSGTRIP